MKSGLLLIGVVLVCCILAAACSKPLPSADQMEQKRNAADKKLVDESGD